MEFKDLKVIIPTCDKYIHITEALMYTTSRFWKEENQFIILGYEHPKFQLNNNWKFISMGKDPGAKYWSNAVIDFFKDFKDEYFINMIDDTIMTRNADIDKMKLAFDYMVKNDSVKKILLQGSLNIAYGNYELFGDISYTNIQELNDMFVDVNQTCQYRTTMQSSILNTQYFIQTLKQDMSPWEYEVQHIKNDGARILTALVNPPLMFGHLCGQTQSPTGKEYFGNWRHSMYENTYLGDEEASVVLQILSK